MVDDSLEICLSEDHFKAGLYLPFSCTVREVLVRFNLAPVYLTPTGYMILYANCIMWPKLSRTLATLS